MASCFEIAFALIMVILVWIMWSYVHFVDPCPPEFPNFSTRPSNETSTFHARINQSNVSRSNNQILSYPTTPRQINQSRDHRDIAYESRDSDVRNESHPLSMTEMIVQPTPVIEVFLPSMAHPRSQIHAPAASSGPPGPFLNALLPVLESPDGRLVSPTRHFRPPVLTIASRPPFPQSDYPQTLTMATQDPVVSTIFSPLNARLLEIRSNLATTRRATFSGGVVQVWQVLPLPIIARAILDHLKTTALLEIPWKLILEEDVNSGAEVPVVLETVESPFLDRILGPNSQMEQNETPMYIIKIWTGINFLEKKTVKKPIGWKELPFAIKWSANKTPMPFVGARSTLMDGRQHVRPDRINLEAIDIADRRWNNIFPSTTYGTFVLTSEGNRSKPSKEQFRRNKPNREIAVTFEDADDSETEDNELQTQKQGNGRMNFTHENSTGESSSEQNQESELEAKVDVETLSVATGLQVLCAQLGDSDDEQLAEMVEVAAEVEEKNLGRSWGMMSSFARWAVKEIVDKTISQCAYK